MDSPLLRLLDANCNRAREALRVIEDYTRFWVESKELSGELKSLRHRLSLATAPFAADAIFHRDTPGDVGTSNKTSRELHRSDAGDVVTAAGKRFGEAIRTLEEFAKTFDVKIAIELESIRYEFYEIEKKISQTLRSSASDFASVRLYVLITESLCKKPWREVAKEAIKGGADCLQLREKDLESGELLARAEQLVAICKLYGVISIINDRPDIAMLCGADGVHLGQTDLPITEARKLLGRSKIIGVSTHTIEQARQAILDGADYIGVGPVFRSATKPREIDPGLPFARQVAQELHHKIPAVAIAGINQQNVDEVLASGIRAIAVSSAVIAADNPQVATAMLKAKLTADERR